MLAALPKRIPTGVTSGFARRRMVITSRQSYRYSSLPSSLTSSQAKLSHSLQVNHQNNVDDKDEDEDKDEEGDDEEEATAEAADRERMDKVRGGDDLFHNERNHFRRSSEFYEEHAANRTYFYYLDLQGRLFIEDVEPKNIATSLKSQNFLRFFFKRLRPNDTNRLEDYPYFSPCGKESNYLIPEDTPIVFERLLTKDEELVHLDQLAQSTEKTEHVDLVYASGGLKHPFNPTEDLRIAGSTNRLYHRLDSHPNFPSDSFMLIHTHLALEMGETSFESMESSESGLGFRWGGELYPLPLL